MDTKKFITKLVLLIGLAVLFCLMLWFAADGDMENIKLIYSALTLICVQMVAQM